MSPEEALKLADLGFALAPSYGGQRNTLDPASANSFVDEKYDIEFDDEPAHSRPCTKEEENQHQESHSKANPDRQR